MMETKKLRALLSMSWGPGSTRGWDSSEPEGLRTLELKVEVSARGQEVTSIPAQSRQKR